MNQSWTLLVIVFLVAFLGCQEQPPPNQWEELIPLVNKSIRGLSGDGNEAVWGSGQNGVFFSTADQGETWIFGRIPGCDSLDLRDIEAHGSEEATAMTAGWPARIYRTYDGGKEWQLQFSDSTPGVFLDGMAWWSDQQGIAYGDPVEGEFYVLRTMDGGASWNRVEGTHLPDPLPGEAGFAASGTGIVVSKAGSVWFGTGGGEQSRVIKSIDYGESWEATGTPMRVGEGMGIFSMAFLDEVNGVLVGGSYLDSTSTQGNCAVSIDGGISWKAVTTQPPNGYRSCVKYIPASNMLIAVGRTGSDYSSNNGATWNSLGSDGYYTLAITSDYVWAAGRNGKMARLRISQ